MNNEVVLVVDFDGSYVKNDFFAERLIKKLIENPFYLIRHFVVRKRDWLQLKIDLLSALTIAYPIEQLVNKSVHQFIVDNRSNYARVVLVSASPGEFVNKVFAGSGVFDEVHGSSDKNLKGAEKLSFIKTKFGNNFHYIGNSTSDDIILRSAAKGYKVINHELNEFR